MSESSNQLRKFCEVVAQLENLWPMKDAEGFLDVKTAGHQMQRIARFILGIFGLAMLHGCQLIEQSGPSGSLHAGHVRIQICLPLNVVEFDDLLLDHLESYPTGANYSKSELAFAPKKIRRIRKSANPLAIAIPLLPHKEERKESGVFSSSGGPIYLADSTVEGQPVFEPNYTSPAAEYIAFGVMVAETGAGSKNDMEYWFRLPKNIPSGAFSRWLEPVWLVPSGHPRDAGLILAHGGTLQAYPIGRDAPKMRVLLVPGPTYPLNPRTDSLPALYTARKQFKKADSAVTFVDEFVKQSDERIPACN